MYVWRACACASAPFVSLFFFLLLFISLIIIVNIITVTRWNDSVSTEIATDIAAAAARGRRSENNTVLRWRARFSVGSARGVRREAEKAKWKKKKKNDIKISPRYQEGVMTAVMTAFRGNYNVRPSTRPPCTAAAAGSERARACMHTLCLIRIRARIRF
jgi:hypothetical protein